MKALEGKVIDGGGHVVAIARVIPQNTELDKDVEKMRTDLMSQVDAVESKPLNVMGGNQWAWDLYTELKMDEACQEYFLNIMVIPISE